MKAKDNAIKKSPLFRELKQYEEAGFSLLLEGEPSGPEEIARACLLEEDCGYMRDFISDEESRIKGISFTRIQR